MNEQDRGYIYIGNSRQLVPDSFAVIASVYPKRGTEKGDGPLNIEGEPRVHTLAQKKYLRRMRRAK